MLVVYFAPLAKVDKKAASTNNMYWKANKAHSGPNLKWSVCKSRNFSTVGYS